MGYARPFELETSAPVERIERAPDRADKLLGLELLRFASALAVLVFHYRHFAYVVGTPALEPGAVPLHAILWPLYDYGLYGVQVFWGISGFIFFWKYGAVIRSGAVAARDFFWLRFSRLYPLHISTLIGVTGLQAIHRQIAGTDFVYPATDPGMFARQLFLATDWGTQSPFSFNGPIWSISAEVAVYAAFFALLRRFAPSMGLCAAVVAMGLVVQLAGLSWVSVGCATYFFAGGLAAMAPGKWRRPAGLTLVLLIVGCAAGGVLSDRGKLPTILLVAVPCLLILVSRGWPGLDRWQRPIQATGNLTYSSYLLHFPLQIIVAIAATASGIVLPLASPLFLLAYVGGTLAIAAISYRAFELPAQNWVRQRMLGARADS
jgi:peptidoglycan/LPS O-acetylase OafA/YrhL